MQFSVQKALVHMNKISESGHSQVALSIKRTSICCECQLPSDLNRFASQLRSCVQKGWGCWTGDKSKYGARCITASAEAAEEEQRRARHGFSTARSPENRRMSQIWRLNVTSSKPKKKRRCLALPKNCKQWGHIDKLFNRNAFQFEFVGYV